MQDFYPMVATTLMGLEQTLADELKELGAQKVEVAKRAVRFLGDEATLYKANLATRTALRILVPIDHFVAYDEDELYLKIKRYNWDKHITKNGTFVIDTTVSSEFFKHSKYVALKSKDAIADRFKEKFGKRPSVDRDNPDIRIHIHIHNNFVDVSLDSTGVSLDKRGYRKLSNQAPINEVLAAGIIQMSGWHGEIPFYDPMAGSGTFGIEAAMIAANIAPGLSRNFAFQKWIDYDAVLFNNIISDLESKISSPKVPIFVRDLLTENLDIIAENAYCAQVDEYINLKREDFFLSEPTTTEGLIVMNPPYGERMKIEQENQFYSNIGDIFKQKYPGFNASIISSNFEAIKKIGLRASKKTQLSNGGLDAMLLQYELFTGKKY